VVPPYFPPNISISPPDLGGLDETLPIVLVIAGTKKRVAYFLCTGVTSASGKSSLLKLASATLLTLTMILNSIPPTFAAGNIVNICRDSVIGL